MLPNNSDFPKDGNSFIADIGLPYAVVATWNASINKIVYASLQVDMVGGTWNDTFFENESISEKELFAWMPLPKIERKKTMPDGD